MQFDIDQAIKVLRDTNADTVDYRIEAENDGKKYLIRITIEAQ